MRPEELLAFSRVLRNMDSPAAKRSSISHAYYGIFHVLQAWLIDENIRIRASGAGHEDVTNALWHSKHPHLRGMSRLAQSRRTLRLGADYRLLRSEFETHGNVVAAVEMAEALLEDLSIFRQLPSNDQSAAIEAMRNEMGLHR